MAYGWLTLDIIFNAKNASEVFQPSWFFEGIKYMVLALIPDVSYIQWKYNMLWLFDVVFAGLGRLFVLLSMKETSLCRIVSNSVRRCPLLSIKESPD